MPENRVDAGLKALAFDSGPPIVCDEPAATYERASDEHGRLAVSAATNRLGLGDKIRLIPGHCDPTVNLYEWYVCVRGNRVEQLWPITARGAVYERETERPESDDDPYRDAVPACCSSRRRAPRGRPRQVSCG